MSGKEVAGGSNSSGGKCEATKLARAAWVAAAVVFAVFFALTAATMEPFGLGFDEGEDLRSAAAVVLWVQALPTRALSESFSRDELQKSWGRDFKHGSVNRMVHAAAWLASNKFSKDTWFKNVTAFRLGTAAAFALLGALAALAAWRCGGPVAGVCAPAFLLGMPRVFAHAHLCATDVMAAACMFAAACAAWRSLRCGGWAVLSGLLLAAAGLCKETCWLLVPLYGVLLIVNRPPGWGKKAALAAAVAVAAFFALQPALWAQPPAGLQRYFHYIFVEARGMEYPWSLYFFKRYTHGAPWHYVPVMLGVTVPVFTLLFMGAGCVRAAVRRGASLWFTLPGAAVVLFFALPGTPAYDCERLVIPAAGFLAVAAGLGAAWLVDRTRGAVRPLLCALVVLICLAGLWRAHPFEAVYYNSLIGGPAGAVRRGMDVDYWNTTLNRAFLHEIDRALPPQTRISTLGCNQDNLRLYQTLGALRSDFRIVPWGAPAQAVLLCSRPAAFDNFAWLLYQKREPLLSVNDNGAMLAGLFVEQ